MKKLFVILCCLVCGVANATEMCARNDTIVVPLDATVAGNGNGYNTVEWMWWATFEYGKIYGIATCLSPAEVAELLPSDDDELLGRSGKDAAAQESGAADNRTHCYCKLTHPMSSSWVYNYQASASNCTGGCARHCAFYTPDKVDLRSGLFGSVGAGM
jgi:hypothetical protein